MKTVLIVLLCLSGLAAAAPHSSIVLNMEVELEPGKVSRPTLRLQEGDWASLTEGSLEMRVRANRGAEDMVAIEAEIRETIKGVPVLKGIPSILTQWGRPAEIRAENENKTLKYRFRVTPEEG